MSSSILGVKRSLENISLPPAKKLKTKGSFCSNSSNIPIPSSSVSNISSSISSVFEHSFNLSNSSSAVNSVATASLGVNSQRHFLAEQELKAKTSDQISEQFKEVLRQSGANMERVDLLEHCSSIFNHYNITVATFLNKFGQFLTHEHFNKLTTYKTVLSYALDSLNPYCLEEEVRKDLEYLAEKHDKEFSLPERLIKDNKHLPTVGLIKQQELQALGMKLNKILDKLDLGKLENLEKYQDEVTDFLDNLIHFNKWDQFKIKSASIKILDINQKENKIFCHLVFKQKIIEFYIDIENFNMLIPDSAESCANTVSTIEFLMLMESKNSSS